MPDAVVSYLGVATADNTDTEITLDNDGFTVSQALEVNTKNVRYTYTAFQGSDCTSADTSMCVGKYTGDGTVSRNITTGFQPDLVWVKRTNATVGSFTTSPLAAVNPLYAAYFSATANDHLGTGLLFRGLNATSFTVGSTNNANGAIYYYVAFKNTANKFLTGSFNGNGIDNRNISGTGTDGIGGTPIDFEPDLVFVKQNAAVGPAFNTTECWGDYSPAVIAGAAALNHIQSLDATGFQVGNSTAVNAAGIISYWFAFGGVADPAPTESFFMEKGSYVGDGSAAKVIPTSFAPDLVFIKARDSAQYAVWSTRMDTDVTHYFAVAAASVAGGIISMSSNSFTVGNHITVNNGLTNYEWVAFGNATSPQTGVHAADFVIGSYSGNGLAPTTTPRIIDHLGITPSFVLVKPSVVAAASNYNFWKTTSMTGANETAYLQATANDVGGTLIRSLDTNGFTMGSNAYVNTSAVVYHFFAFKEGAGIFDVGTYDGNGVAGRQITGLGFQPDLVWTKRNTNTAGAHRSSSPGIPGAYSQHFLATVDGLDIITEILGDGFRVGTSAYANSATAPPAYHYVAWNSTYSVHAPDTPTNSSPAALETGVNLNATLTGSAYNDQDSDAQTNAQWQVDDDSDFATPVWTRTAGAAEITTSVTPGNGTFANELSGKTELDHNSSYYWRGAYSDGTWSTWSTGTSFTTNTLSTPTHSSPADGTTVTTLTPTLTASAFADAQPGHTHLAAQWQIDTSNSFAAPFYDSGAIAPGNSLAVPTAILSDHSTYYWRVRYEDSSGQWSAYSTATRFLVSESKVVVTPIFGGTVVDEGDAVNIDVQVRLSDGTPINDATVTINIYNPLGERIVGPVSMSYLADSNGLYRHPYTVPAASGSYLYEVAAASGDVTGYGAANFEVRTIAADVSSTKADVESEQAAQTAERAAQGAERTAQEASRTKLDILVGAMIVTQANVNDAAPSTTSFVTTLTNSADDFYKNGVLTFTSGDLDGQNRRVAAYDGATKTITLDPALTSEPADGDAFTIVTQNVRVEEQMTEHETAEAIERTAQAAFRTDTTTRLTDIEDKIDSISGELDTLDTNLATILSTVNTIRTFQLEDSATTLAELDDIDSEIAGARADLAANALGLTNILASLNLMNPVLQNLLSIIITKVDGLAAQSETDVEDQTDSDTGSQNIDLAMTEIRADLADNAANLTSILASLDIMSPALQNLLSVTATNTEDLTDLHNKVADLHAVSADTRRIIEERATTPIVETYMTFNSVEINFLITNPDSTSQTIQFKAFLPEEAKPENIIDKSGLEVAFDASANVYYVFGDIDLGPKESVTRKVEMKDIWVFPPEEIQALKDQAENLIPTLAKTQYEAQGSLLKNDIDTTLDTVSIRQEASFSSPQDHIVAYRENTVLLAKATNNLEKLKDLVVQAGASRGMLGQVGGIQTFATWGIILAIIFGFGLLAAVVFSMWRHQTMLAAVAMDMNKDELFTHFSGAGKRRSQSRTPEPIAPHHPPLHIPFIWNLSHKRKMFLLLIIGMVTALIIVAVYYATALWS